MDQLVTIGSTLVGLGFAAIVWWFSRREARGWRRAADALGLSRGPEALSLDGQLDGCRVVARSGADSQGNAEVIVRPEAPLPAGLAFGPEGWVQSVLKTVTGADVTTGDRRFDDAVMMIGDPPLVLAVLDPANRRLVRRLVAEGVVLDGGELRLRGRRVRGRGLAETIRALVRACRALSIDPAQIPDRLAERVRRDPLPDVRRRALDLLLARLPDAPQTTAALDAALRDRDPALRLSAARHLDADRDPDGAAEAPLRALAADAAVDRRVREDALDLYIDRFGPRRASPLLVELLADDALGGGAASRLARTGRAEALPALRAHLSRGDVGARAECAVAVGKLGDARDPTLEVALLPLLDTPALRIPAADALARVGTGRAIEALLPLTEGLLTGGDVKAAAQRALNAIRARRGDGEGVGGLSVASGGEAGRLAVIEAGGGALSPSGHPIPDEEAP